jgi:hypothetical protein
MLFEPHQLRDFALPGETRQDVIAVLANAPNEVVGDSEVERAVTTRR